MNTNKVYARALAGLAVAGMGFVLGTSFFVHRFAANQNKERIRQDLRQAHQMLEAAAQFRLRTLSTCAGSAAELPRVRASLVTPGLDKRDLERVALSVQQLCSGDWAALLDSNGRLLAQSHPLPQPQEDVWAQKNTVVARALQGQPWAAVSRTSDGVHYLAATPVRSVVGIDGVVIVGTIIGEEAMEEMEHLSGGGVAIVHAAGALLSPLARKLGLRADRLLPSSSVPSEQEDVIFGAPGAESFAILSRSIGDGAAELVLIRPVDEGAGLAQIVRLFLLMGSVLWMLALAGCWFYARGLRTRHEMEKRLKEETTPLTLVAERLLEVIPDAALLVEPGGIIQKGNAAAAKLLGYSEEELHAKFIVDLLEGTKQLEGIQHFQTAFIKAASCCFRRKDGGRFQTILSAMVVTQSADEGVTFLCVLQDLRDRKRASVLEQTYAQLAQEQQRLQETLGKLRRKKRLENPKTAKRSPQDLLAGFWAVSPTMSRIRSLLSCRVSTTYARRI